MLDRRSLIAGGLVAGGSWFWPFPAIATTANLYFEARRNGDPIGHHAVRFSEKEGRLIVDIEISLAVTFAFIPLYRYQHENREVWTDGRLLRLDSKTDDDGDEHWVSARADGNEILVDSSAGRIDVPRDTLPTSYWNEEMLTRDVWLDTQAGVLRRSRVEVLPPGPIVAAGREVEANRYRLAGDIDCELWYHKGRWSKLLFTASDGSTIDYLLLASSPDAP
ncbi:MAG: DUF6134 family protein [Pseudomonadota bacterium]